MRKWHLISHEDQKTNRIIANANGLCSDHPRRLVNNASMLRMKNMSDPNHLHTANAKYTQSTAELKISPAPPNPTEMTLEKIRTRLRAELPPGPYLTDLDMARIMHISSSKPCSRSNWRRSARCPTSAGFRRACAGATVAVRLRAGAFVEVFGEAFNGVFAWACLWPVPGPWMWAAADHRVRLSSQGFLSVLQGLRRPALPAVLAMGWAAKRV